MFKRNFCRSYTLSAFPFVTQTSTFQKNKENKQLILSILKQTTTKRETNTYLNRYQGCFDESQTLRYPKRYLIFKITGDFNSYNTERIGKLKETLDYVTKLGGSPIILLDSDQLVQSSNNFNQSDSYFLQQFNKLDSLIGGELNLLPLRSSLVRTQGTFQTQSSLIKNISDFSKIPVLFPIVYDSETSKESIIPSTEFLVHFIQSTQSQTSEDNTFEKVIFIDKNGGIPSPSRSNDSHIFINLKQEYQGIVNELESNSLQYQETHLKNLRSMNEILTVIDNESATGLITTLEIAIENLDLNPIIYNVLTDRSLVSSSLSPVKFKSNDKLFSKISKTTILKHGIELDTYYSFDQVDLVKLKKLIDDSFKRSINLDHYLGRIKHKVSQIIVIGDYDGIAIITNETSQKTGETYPYLDKFAVRRSKQGSLGVADIIFNHMLRSYKDQFLIWRSKKINPVNGWYFQRSNGSYNIENSEFRLFWNGWRHKFDQKKLESFIDIVKYIEPSWDKK